MSGVFAAFGKEVRKRGRAEGIAIGEARGEERGKRAVVHSMLANGCSLEEIVRLTSLSLSEVKTLARQQEPPVGHS